MTVHDSDLDAEFEEEPIEVQTRRPAGGVISVRFNPEEMRLLRDEMRHTGEKASTLVRTSTLAAIQTRRLFRDLEVSIQSPGLASLHANWTFIAGQDPLGLYTAGQRENSISLTSGSTYTDAVAQSGSQLAPA